MKKVKIEGKLSLGKETIAKLNDSQMGNVKGGATWSLICGGSSKCNTGNASCFNPCSSLLGCN